MSTSIIDVVMRLQDQVSSTLRGINENMKQNANLNKRLGAQTQAVGRGFTAMGNALLPASAAITAVGAIGVKTFMDFESTITGAAVKAGAIDDEMQQMLDTAKRLGAEYPISANDAAKAMDRLAAGGFNAKQTMAAMPAIIEAAVASGEDMAQTSDVVTSALSIWNMTQGDVAANATRVADVVQTAANVSKLGMQDFGLAMQYAGAPAAALGVSVKQLGAAMAVMSNNGIEASSIGTGLRSIFSRLVTPPKEAAEAIEAMGLTIKDSQGNFIGLENAIGQMRKAMAGMSDTEQVAMAKAIAGKDAYSGLLSLIKTSPEAYAQVADAINDCAGSSHEAYIKMQDTLKGSVEAMKGSLESLGISFGETLAPKLRVAADAIGKFADFLTNLSPAARSMIADVAMGVVGFTAFNFAIGKVMTLGGKAISIYSDIGTVLNGGRLGKNYKLLELSVKGVQSAYGGLRTAAAEAATAMQAAAANNSWRTVLSGAGSGIKSGVGGVMSTIKTGAIDAGTAVAGMVRNFSVAGSLKTAQTALVGFARTLMTVSRAGLAAAFSPIGIAIMMIAGAAYVLYKNWDKVAPFFVSMWNQIKAAFGTALDRIRPAIDALQAAWERVVAAFESNSGTFATIGHILQFAATILGGLLLSAIIEVAAVFTGVFVAAVEVVGAVIQTAIGVFAGLVDFITGVFTGNWEQAWQGVVKIFSSIFGGIKGICEGILDGVKAAINSVIGGINSLNFTVPDWVPVIGGQQFAPNLPMLAHGTENWGGGPAIINDAGAEIVNLPSGAQVIPHEQSMQQAYKAGQRSGGGISGINISIANANFSNDKDAKTTIREIADQLLFELETRSINQNVGAV